MLVRTRTGRVCSSSRSYWIIPSQFLLSSCMTYFQLTAPHLLDLQDRTLLHVLHCFWCHHAWPTFNWRQHSLFCRTGHFFSVSDAVMLDLPLDVSNAPPCLSPWYNRNGWLGIKHHVTYLLTPPCFAGKDIASLSLLSSYMPYCLLTAPRLLVLQDRTLLHVQSGTCLAASPSSSDLSLQPCTDSAWLKWTLTPRRTDRVFPWLATGHAGWQWLQTHSKHRFLAPSSKLCQIWLRHWMGTLYLRAAVHWHSQRPLKGLVLIWLWKQPSAQAPM